MPELGINAIYLAADALGKIQHFRQARRIR
jgi:hypothetical protein